MSRLTLPARQGQEVSRRTAQTYANLLGQEMSLWTFVRHTGVEPTNNAAGQALRAGPVPSLLPSG